LEPCEILVNIYHDLENPDSVSLSSSPPETSHILSPSRRKIPIDESLQQMTFDLASSSSTSSAASSDSELEQLAKGNTSLQGIVGQLVAVWQNWVWPNRECCDTLMSVTQ